MQVGTSQQVQQRADRQQQDAEEAKQRAEEAQSRADQAPSRQQDVENVSWHTCICFWACAAQDHDPAGSLGHLPPVAASLPAAAPPVMPTCIGQQRQLAVQRAEDAQSRADQAFSRLHEVENDKLAHTNFSGGLRRLRSSHCWISAPRFLLHFTVCCTDLVRCIMLCGCVLASMTSDVNLGGRWETKSIYFSTWCVLHVWSGKAALAGGCRW